MDRRLGRVLRERGDVKNRGRRTELSYEEWGDRENPRDGLRNEEERKVELEMGEG